MSTKRNEADKQKQQLIRRFLHGSVGYFVVSILMTVISSIANMLSPQIIRVAIDNVIGGAAPTLPGWVLTLVDQLGGFAYLAKHLWILAVAVLIVAAIKVGAQYMFRVYNTKACETLVKTMRDSLFRHIERLPFSWHMKHQTGDIIQRCTSDIETTRNFVSEQLTSILNILLLLALSIAFMASMSMALTLWALVPVPFIILYSVYFHKKMGEGFRACDEEEGRLSAMAQENLTGVRVVRAFGRERYEDDRFKALNKHYTGLWVKLAELMSRFWCSSDVLSYLQVMLVVVLGCVYCVQGRMTAGEYVAFISYNAMLTWPIRQLGRMIAEMSKAGVSVDRILDIMEAEEEQDRPNAVSPELNGDIVFDHVSFAYDNAPETLHDICLHVKAGSTVGILGGTGSGKSTLMYLLDRLYDLPEENGRITIGGTDLRDIAGNCLRSQIGIVLQEPFLFSRTLQDNIGIQGSVTLSDIREAARAACLDDTIQSFPKGYDTQVGERGVTLSGGQKQRAAIARMLVKHTPIMILDDSLSAVDTATDAKIRTALEQRFGSATIFLISHRITTLSRADQVIVLEHGRIAEQGTPDELRHGGGVYQRIAELQSAVGEEAV